MKSRPATAATSVPIPKMRNAPRDPSRAISQPRFWPKNPVRKDSGRKMVAMMVARWPGGWARLRRSW